MILDKSATKEQLIDILNSMKFPIMGAGGGFAPIGMYGWSPDYVTGAPQGWLRCEGQEVNIADYPELATFYASQHGASNYWGGDGITTFAVPDLRGEFIRGAGTNSHANQGNGGEVGEHQDATVFPYIAANNGGTQINARKYSNPSGSVPSNMDSQKNPTRNLAITNATYTPSGSSSDMPELYTSRPTNTSGVFFVKATVSGDANAHQYSTEEQVVGMTEDGEVLYEITINGTTPSTSVETTQSISSSVVSNINKIYDANISIFYTTGGGAKGTAKVPIYWGSGYASCITLSDDGLLSLDWYVTNSAFQNKSFRATIRYTKTQS